MATNRTVTAAGQVRNDGNVSITFTVDMPVRTTLADGSVIGDWTAAPNIAASGPITLAPGGLSSVISLSRSVIVEGGDKIYAMVRLNRISPSPASDIIRVGGLTTPVWTENMSLAGSLISFIPGAAATNTGFPRVWDLDKALVFRRLRMDMVKGRGAVRRVTL